MKSVFWRRNIVAVGRFFEENNTCRQYNLALGRKKANVKTATQTGKEPGFSCVRKVKINLELLHAEQY